MARTQSSRHAISAAITSTVSGPERGLEPSGAARLPAARRALLVNLDFRDFVYSWLWGRAVTDACARRNLVVDMVAVDPFVGRDLSAELGMPRSALQTAAAGTALYLDTPDPSRCRSAIAQLLERHHYDMVIVNCDASLFLYLMLEREGDFAGSRWLVYDRHLHVELRAHEHDARLRDRIIASGMHMFSIQEIAIGNEREIVGVEGRTDAAPARLSDRGDHGEGSTSVRQRLWRRLARRPWLTKPDTTTTPRGPSAADDLRLIGSFKRLGLTTDKIHLQKWPLDDAFFAPRREAATDDTFVVFTGGDSGRDYATLFAAVGDLPLRVHLCAGSHPTPVPPNVVILPRLRLHQFRDEMARAAVTVVPLTREPPVSGITVVAMAMMMGKPVIASDTPVVRMHIRAAGDGGHLAPVGDADALRALLIRLMESPVERERVGQQARAQAARDLSLTAFADRMLACDAEVQPDVG